MDKEFKKSNKFIVDADGRLILGEVKYHRDLLVAYYKPEILGGGIFRKTVGDSGEDVIILSGKSTEFGPAPIEKIKECIQKNNVFGVKEGVGMWKFDHEEYKFDYYTGSETIDISFDPKEELLDCIQNLIGVFDNPVSNAKISNSFANEAREQGRMILEKYGRKVNF